MKTEQITTLTSSGWVVRMVLILLGLVNLWSVQAFAETDWQSIYQVVRPTVVFIESGEHGTGFIATSNGCMITAAHVLGSATQETLKTRLDNGEIYESFQILSFDYKNDIAILKIEAENLPHVSLGDSDLVQELDEILSIGFPRPDIIDPGIPTADTGRVQAIGVTIEYIIGGGRLVRLEDVIQVGGTIRPGSSGGPIFNVDGKVIGVVAATPKSADLKIAYIMPINRVSIPQICSSIPQGTEMYLPLVAVLGLVIIGSLGLWVWRGRAKPNVLGLLKIVSLFSGLSDDELKILLDKCKSQEFAKNDYVIQEGDMDSRKMFLICQGQVEVRSGGNLIGKRGVGRTIGEMSLFDGKPRSADVVAVRKTLCLKLTHEDLLSLVKEHPDVAMKILADLAYRLRDLTKETN